MDLGVTGVTETPGGPFNCHFACVALFIFTTLPPPSMELDDLGAAGVRDTDPFVFVPPNEVTLPPAGGKLTEPLLPDPLGVDVTGDPLEIWAETAGVPPFGVSVTEPVAFGEICFWEPSFINLAIPEVTGCFVG